MKRTLILLFGMACIVLMQSNITIKNDLDKGKKNQFHIERTDSTFQVFGQNGKIPLVTQNARPNFRPYMHPITAPGSDISLTQYSPGHHKHQTGLFWGFTRVNGTGIDKKDMYKWFYNPKKPDSIAKMIGRDFYHYPDGDHWQKISAEVLKAKGKEVKWQTVYNMLDASRKPILKETQTWTFTEQDGKYLLSLEWKGEALIDITVNQFDYGGMFLRMPWSRGVKGEAVNSSGQKNQEADGQSNKWVDVGMEIEGLDQWGHIVIMDHPGNAGFPSYWRVDGQLGVGPIRAKMEDWHIKKGETEIIRKQIVAYSGTLDAENMNGIWDDYAKNK